MPLQSPSAPLARAATLPQRTAAYPTRVATRQHRVLDVKREPQQLSLFGRPAGAFAGHTRID